VFPLLMLFLLGVIEYGWMMLKNQEIKNASRHGARIGVREIVTNAQVNTAVDQMMTAAGMSGSGYTVTLTPTDVSTVAPGNLVKVRIAVPYANVGLTDTPFLPTPTSLIEETTMVKEGAQ
jgi:Flp pilus assembly protein TadG